MRRTDCMNRAACPSRNSENWRNGSARRRPAMATEPAVNIELDFLVRSILASFTCASEMVRRGDGHTNSGRSHSESIVFEWMKLFFYSISRFSAPDTIQAHSDPPCTNEAHPLPLTAHAAQMEQKAMFRDRKQQ